VQQTARYFDTEVRKACIVDQAALQTWQQEHCYTAVIVTSQQHVVNVSDELGSCNAVLFCHFPTRLTWLVASYSAGFIAARQQFQCSKDNSFVLTAPQSRSVKTAFGFQFPADATFSNKYQHTQQSMQQQPMQQHAHAHATASTSPCSSKQ
jgi:hypothetical protein